VNFTTIFRSVSLQIAIFFEQQHIHRASPVQEVAKICAAFEAFYLSYLVGRLMIFNPPLPLPLSIILVPLAIAAGILWLPFLLFKVRAHQQCHNSGSFPSASTARCCGGCCG